MVRDGQTGVMVPPENAALLASAIVALLRDPTRRERLGTAARKLIEDEFSADRMTADYLRVYAKAASRGTAK
jgi:glycosyltransferase involved in cell wall biosynthesis